MDDKLKGTIDRIVQLTKQNAEFDAELRKRLGVSSANFTCVDGNKISNIEKYLGLDYYVDSKSTTASYSFITTPSVRAQLISDNREMMRFRYGTRYHQIDFSEFCRYALLQSEMLLNYYYDQMNDTLSEIIDHIKRFNSSAKISSNVSTLGAISYGVKLYAFTSENNCKSIYTVWNYIREMRNLLSHRSTEKATLEIETYKAKLINLGMPLSKDGLVNWNNVSQNTQKKAVYEKQIMSSPEYKEYCFLVWAQNKPFDEVVEYVNNFATLVKEAL